MLKARNITFEVAKGKTSHKILDGINIDFQESKLHALIGPSGCGKSTLLQGMLRLNKSNGNVYYKDSPITNSSQLSGKVGFVPQFSIAYEQLTVTQNLLYFKKLFNPEADVSAICAMVGLKEHADKKVDKLSGGQKRRLSLALELVNDPECLVCDEVTTGLDPQSESEILELLRALVNRGITVICVIHNLNQLEEFDQIHILRSGRVHFQGSYEEMIKAYALTNPCLVYSKLDTFSNTFELTEISDTDQEGTTNSITKPQLGTLLQRRFHLFFQDRSQLILTCLLTFGFPFLVVIFAFGGLPQIESLNLQANYNVIERFEQEVQATTSFLRVGSLVSGIIIFQVILLTLMGANNGSREIASELNLFKKERFLGLNVTSYLASKLVFLLCLSAVQGVWMCFFVKTICQIPGSFIAQSLILTATVFTMSVTTLCISAFANSSEKASLVSTYLVGFQLPLSGTVLALPDSLIWVFRPFIATYWGWSGYLDSLAATRFYDTVTFAIEQFPVPLVACLLVLILHILVSITVTIARLSRIH